MNHVETRVERLERLRQKGGWIGVDFDGTLAVYGRWDGGKVGAPIPRMVERVKAWLAAGIEVRIVTARVGPSLAPAEIVEARQTIDAWLEQHLGRTLLITASKDHRMVELWDDRAVQVIQNTGERADGLVEP